VAPPRLGKRDRNDFTALPSAWRWRKYVGEDEVRKAGRANASDWEMDAESDAVTAVVAAMNFIVEMFVLIEKYWRSRED